MTLHRRALTAVSVLAVSLLLVALAGLATVQSAGSPAAAATPSPRAGACAGKSAGIHVVGNVICRGATRFVPRGVIMEGYQFPKQSMTSCTPMPGTSKKDADKLPAFCKRHLLAQKYATGKGRYAGANSAPARAIADFHANTIRFNLNQALLDPTSPLARRKDGDSTWGAEYVTQVQQAVDYARKSDLVVILTLFSGRLAMADHIEVAPGTGRSVNALNPNIGLPTPDTDSALQHLVRAFGSKDPNVLLEAYNEPHKHGRVRSRTDATHCYVSGTHCHGEKLVGLRTIIDHARTAVKPDYRAPIIVGALGKYDFSKKSAFNAGQLGDKNLIYAVHPFLFAGFAGDTATSAKGAISTWNKDFGYLLGENHPVLATAWEAHTVITQVPARGDFAAKDNSWCYTDPLGVKLPAAFADYADSKGIGILGFAFDVPYTMTINIESKAPDVPSTFPKRVGDARTPSRLKSCGDHTKGHKPAPGTTKQDIGELLQTLFAQQAKADKG